MQVSRRQGKGFQTSSGYAIWWIVGHPEANARAYLAE
jgi:hypothetical protein